MAQASFVARAIIHVGRWQHHRQRDHFGVESDLYVVLNERLGPWEEGTPVHFVIDDLLTRLNSLESSGHVLGSFTCNSYLLTPGSYVEGPANTWKSAAFADAIIKKVAPGSFIANALKVGGARITADAVIRGKRTFTANAVLV